MNFTIGRWILTIGIALMGHVILFAGIEVDDKAKVQRAAGINIAVGSLSSFAAQIEARESKVTESVEPTDTAKNVLEVSPIQDVKAENLETFRLDTPSAEQTKPDQSAPVKADAAKAIDNQKLAALEVKPDQIITSQAKPVTPEKVTKSVSVTPQPVEPVIERKQLSPVKTKKKSRTVKKKKTVKKRKITKTKTRPATLERTLPL